MLQKLIIFKYMRLVRYVFAYVKERCHMVPFKVLIKSLTQPNFRSLLNIINTRKGVSIKTTLALILFKKSSYQISQYYSFFSQLRLPSCGINIL